MFKCFLVAASAIVVTLVCTESADAQLFRGRNIRSARVWSTPASIYRAPSVQRTVTARPVTGYGSNLHRNFVIRQEQQRTQRTGLAPRSRGNILWAR